MALKEQGLYDAAVEGIVTFFAVNLRMQLQTVSHYRIQGRPEAGPFQRGCFGGVLRDDQADQ